MEENLLEKIVSWAKRRGFIFPSSEIYGGVGAVYDWGPLGILLKNNLKAAWWKSVVQERDDIVGLDSAILMNRKVWQASGHEESFFDLLVDCKECKHRFRADHLLVEKTQEDAVIRKEEEIKKLKKKIEKIKCPECGGKLTKPRPFNLMLKTFLGPVEEASTQTYLRPETAQGIFTNFKNILNSTRKKIPFGVAQIGKAFRNEITVGPFLFREREFEQMEIEFFVPPPKKKSKTPQKWFDYWVNERLKWYYKIGIRKENLRTRAHCKDELAHYAIGATDIEYRFPWGWQEIEGIANRGDYDLKVHQTASGKDLTYFDQETLSRYLPWIIEPSGGIDRTILALLFDAYTPIEKGREREERREKEKEEEEEREEVVLKINPDLAPIKVAIFPLVSKDRLPKIGLEIYKKLKNYWFVEYDEAGSIGRRYRRQDEIGTPYCITVDFQTLKKNDVTIRDRNTMRQERMKIKEIWGWLEERL